MARRIDGQTDVEFATEMLREMAKRWLVFAELLENGTQFPKLGRELRDDAHLIPECLSYFFEGKKKGKGKDE